MPDDLVNWVSCNFLPGSGPQGPLDKALLQRCSKIFQAHPSAEGFCPECGLQLIFAADLPDLGTCQCGRKYREDDLTHLFCSTCRGEPISFDETIKVECQKQKEIAKLLSAIRDLQERRYLAQNYVIR